MKTAEMDRATTNNLQLEQAPVAKTGMLIRRPVADVFAAFISFRPLSAMEGYAISAIRSLSLILLAYFKC